MARFAAGDIGPAIEAFEAALQTASPSSTKPSLQAAAQVEGDTRACAEVTEALVATSCAHITETERGSCRQREGKKCRPTFRLLLFHALFVILRTLFLLREHRAFLSVFLLNSYCIHYVRCGACSGSATQSTTQTRWRFIAWRGRWLRTRTTSTRC